ncbi:MAG: hypothetical protein AAFQ23_11165 [Cyanobacteria bacterium J06623_1]
MRIFCHLFFENFSLIFRDRILAETTAKTEDNLIQLPYFRGVKAERFKIGLTLNSAEHQEEFVI